METLVALGTLALAVVTAYLAWKTRSLAVAATEDQRSRWRPILIPADEAVDEDVEGELRIRVRNVGEGPALGVGGQLRIKGPSGASILGTPSTALVDEVLEMRFSLRERDFPRGLVVRFEVTYLDIKEWVYVTDITAIIREQPNGTKPLRIANAYVSETGRRLGPIFGSRRAKAEADRMRSRPWNRLRRYLKEKIAAIRPSKTER